jgi:hypothetical protein
MYHPARKSNNIAYESELLGSSFIYIRLAVRMFTRLCPGVEHVRVGISTYMLNCNAFPDAFDRVVYASGFWWILDGKTNDN